MFLRFLNLCNDIFDHVEQRLDKKATVNFKIYDVTDWETNNSNTHIPNISRSKGNQAIKFSQLLE